MKKALTVVCLAGVAGLLAAGTAVAAPPTITHDTVPTAYTLSGSETGCGFPIQVQGTDKVVIRESYDMAGNLTRVAVHDDFVGTESANGVTVGSSEHATITDDAVTGTETWTGQPLKLSAPGGGTITLDAGKLVWNADGTVAVEHGPHPYLDGDVAAYCGAFGA